MGKEREGAPSSFVIVCMLDRLDIRFNVSMMILKEVYA